MRGRCRRDVQRWRTEDIGQRVLNNAVMMWDRYAEANRRFSEERSEQLKSFANLAALITGFAIVAFLQVLVEAPDLLGMSCLCSFCLRTGTIFLSLQCVKEAWYVCSLTSK